MTPLSDLGDDTAMIGSWVNPCGGVRWRELSDGRIEVEGHGVPNWPVGSAQRKYLTQTWLNWRAHFEAASRKHGLPAHWLAAIATMETGLWSGNPAKQASITSEDGYGSVGVMQPLAMVATLYGYKPDDRYDPAKNIDMCTRLLVANLKTKNGQLGRFPVIAAMFNGGASGGGCNPGNDIYNLKGYRAPGWPSAVYAGNSIRYNNAAVELGIGRGASSTSAAVYALGGILAVGVVALASGYVKLR